MCQVIVKREVGGRGNRDCRDRKIVGRFYSVRIRCQIICRGSKMQDVVDGLGGPTDCDVARPSIATDPSTILSTGGMVKARSSLHWPITDLSEWVNGSQSRSGGHEGQCTTTIGRQAEPKGGIKRATSQGNALGAQAAHERSPPRHPPFKVMLRLGGIYRRVDSKVHAFTIRSHAHRIGVGSCCDFDRNGNMS